MKELMFELSRNLGFLLLFIVGTIAVIVITVSILRWAFRINEIADYLKRIADHLSPVPPKPPRPQTVRGKCDYCCKWFFIETLTTMKDNKMFCPTCAKKL